MKTGFCLKALVSVFYVVLIGRILVASQLPPTSGLQVFAGTSAPPSQGAVVIPAIPSTSAGQSVTEAPVAPLGSVISAMPTLPASIPTAQTPSPVQPPATTTPTPSAVPIVVQQPPASQIQTATAPTVPALLPSNPALTTFLISSVPLFSTNGKDKLQEYQDFLKTITIKISVDIFEKGIDTFLSTVVSAALAQSNISLRDIDYTRRGVEQTVSTLVTMNNQLTNIKGTESLRQSVSQRLAVLKSRLTDLTMRWERQKSLKKDLNNAEVIPNEQLKNKINKYASLLVQMDQMTLDELKQQFVNQLQVMLTYGKSKKESVNDALKKLITDAQTNALFNIQQKQQLQGMLVDSPAVAVQKSLAIQPSAVGAAQGNPAYQAKLIEIKAKPTYLEKITGVRDLLTLITGATVQGDKNGLVSFCNELFLAQAAMNKNELTELSAVFALTLSNLFLLAPNQRPVMEQWIKSIDTALSIAQDNQLLLTTIKNSLSADIIDYSQAIKIAYFATNLLDVKLPPEELDKKKPRNFISLLRARMSVLYNNRTEKTIDDIKNLKTLFELVLQKRDLDQSVAKAWLDTLDINMILLNEKLQTTVLGQLNDLEDISQKLSFSTDKYELGLYVNELTTMFVNRKDRAAKEIEVLKNLVIRLSASDIKSRRIFDRPTAQMIDMWREILGATLALLNVNASPSLNEKIKTVRSVLQVVAHPRADYEKTLVVAALSSIFVQRGDMMRADLQSVHDLCLHVKKTPNVLIANQLSVLLVWLEEMQQALAITLTTKTYIDVVVEQACQRNDIMLFVKALSLFTPTTDVAIKNRFIQGLNALLTYKDVLDTKQLKALLTSVNSTKINGAPFLSNKQQVVLNQWLVSLG